MLIKIKHDPRITVTGNKPAQAASSLKRQKLYAKAARFWLKYGRLQEARHMMKCWHHERVLWAHVMGVAV